MKEIHTHAVTHRPAHTHPPNTRTCGARACARTHTKTRAHIWASSGGGQGSVWGRRGQGAFPAFNMFGGPVPYLCVIGAGYVQLPIPVLNLGWACGPRWSRARRPSSASHPGSVPCQEGKPGGQISRARQGGMDNTGAMWRLLEVAPCGEHFEWALTFGGNGSRGCLLKCGPGLQLRSAYAFFSMYCAEAQCDSFVYCLVLRY